MIFPFSFHFPLFPLKKYILPACLPFFLKKPFNSPKQGSQPECKRQSEQGLQAAQDRDSTTAGSRDHLHTGRLSKEVNRLRVSEGSPEGNSELVFSQR